MSLSVTKGSGTVISLDKQQARLFRELLNHIDVENYRQACAEDLHQMTNVGDVVKGLHDFQVAMEVLRGLKQMV